MLTFLATFQAGFEKKFKYHLTRSTSDYLIAHWTEFEILKVISQSRSMHYNTSLIQLLKNKVMETQIRRIYTV